MKLQAFELSMNEECREPALKKRSVSRAAKFK
jgi:hypothetical protein